MSAANAFFAIAGGMSPSAMKNFADGLGVGTKQMTGALQDYRNTGREINKAQRELDKLQLATNMGHAEKGSEREDKQIARIEGFKLKQQQGLQQFAATLTTQAATSEDRARRMTETERYNRAKEDADRAALAVKTAAAWDTHVEKNPEISKLQRAIGKETDSSNRALLQSQYNAIKQNWAGAQSAGAGGKYTPNPADRAILDKYK
jgi:hypothetical protein